MKISPKKSLGQNFLVNPHIIDLIVSSAEISKDDIILEVGPGTGYLTKKLIEKSQNIIAIEKDQRLIEPLKESFKEYPNIKIIEADILEFKPADHNLQPTAYKVIGNIPYYLTSHLIRNILEEWPKPKSIILTIQKEVAQRMVAKPPHMNLLALSVQYYSSPEIIKIISKNNFRPIPKVDSAIIKLVPKDIPYSRDESKELFELAKAGFSEKRKQLAGTLASKLRCPKEQIIKILTDINLEPTTRAENLTLDQWITLKKHIDSL